MCKKIKYLLFVVILGMLNIIQPNITLANSAEPPAIVILINNPPNDLVIELVSQDNQPEAAVHRVAWEGYYAFYSRDIQTSSTYTFRIATSNDSFTCSIEGALEHYNNVYTLDMKNQSLTPGTSPLRSVLLVSLRVLLTLIIEGIIFWLFGFRDKRSWIIFLIINLITQGTLNILLNNAASPLPSSYIIFSLVFGEFFVFITEMIAFPIFIKEYGKVHTVIYAFVANLISLIVGGYIISLLPV